ncbi:MAG: NAD-dependent SIR2 family protein deacetylase [Planctomycetota bacterium]|jgi:NAD-dependent SIR2 family protein deacetylase
MKSFVEQHRPIAVLTGAGVSTASGIPDYRDAQGEWKLSPPMQFQEFIGSETARKRYWARSALARERFQQAKPNTAHVALADFERLGLINGIITQNVDELHRQAGSECVINLHGNLRWVVCIDCQAKVDRNEIQTRLLARNPELTDLKASMLPDGDAKLEGFDFSAIEYPDCQFCGGLLKPDVVFYGESVPRERVQACFELLDGAEALLVVGSSLMVYSGFRFARYMHERNKPVAAINQGVTRADGLLTIKSSEECGALLQQLLRNLEA